jgi:hypothetical protein
MGAELAVHAKQPAGQIGLSHFADVIVAKLELELGVWVIIGRAAVLNGDHDPQFVTARIVHDANVIIDNISLWSHGSTRHCLAVQGTLKSRRPETVVLACNTFSGYVESGSLIAFKVDDAVP